MSEMGEAMDKQGGGAASSSFSSSPPTSQLFPSSYGILFRTNSTGKDRGHIPGVGALLPFRSVAIAPPGSL